MKKFFSAGLACLMLVWVLAGCSQNKDTGLTKITLNEVAHSIFYAPMYVAIEDGYFEEEGLDIKLVNGAGADNVMTALISGDADIGFMGPESTIYVYNEGSKNYAVNFAQLTQRAGNFLVSREPVEDFQWSDLKGTTVIGGRAGGMPQMVFEYVLKSNDIDITNDLDIIQNIDFGITAEAFAGGTGDYTVEFEPHATALELNGNGYVIASLGVDSGYIPYTCFSALGSYIEENPDVIEAFTKAVQKGLDYVATHTADEIADMIQPQFEETDFETLRTIVERYHDQDSWTTNCVFSPEAFDLLQDVLDEAGELSQRVDYDVLVNTEFAESVK